MEHRARRRDLVVDEHTLFDFYDARIGPEVVSGAHFDTLVEAGAAGAARPADLRPGDAHPRERRRGARGGLPADVGGGGAGRGFPISYVFQPGTPEDGLTIDVPVATLNRVQADDFSWNHQARPCRRCAHRADHDALDDGGAAINAPVTFTGELTATTTGLAASPVPNAGVGLYARPASSGTWTKVASATTDDTGRYEVTTRVTTATDYQAVFAGNPTYAVARSTTGRVTAPARAQQRVDLHKNKPVYRSARAPR